MGFKRRLKNIFRGGKKTADRVSQSSGAGESEDDPEQSMSRRPPESSLAGRQDGGHRGRSPPGHGSPRLGDPVGQQMPVSVHSPHGRSDPPRPHHGAGPEDVSQGGDSQEPVVPRSSTAHTDTDPTLLPGQNTKGTTESDSPPITSPERRVLPTLPAGPSPVPETGHHIPVQQLGQPNTIQLESRDTPPVNQRSFGGSPEAAGTPSRSQLQDDLAKPKRRESPDDVPKRRDPPTDGPKRLEPSTAVKKWRDPPADRPWQTELSVPASRLSQGDQGLRDARGQLRHVPPKINLPAQTTRQHSLSEPDKYGGWGRPTSRGTSAAPAGGGSGLRASYQPSQDQRSIQYYSRPISQGKSQTMSPRLQSKVLSEKGKVDLMQRYNMKNPRRGIAIIFNIGQFTKATGMKDRPGYEQDGRLMKDTFKRLGFEVHYYQNKRMTEILRIMSRASMESHHDADCFVCVIMSHGTHSPVYGGDAIYATDGVVSLDQLLVYYNGIQCPSLAGKPKLFFIQACRGYFRDPGVLVPDGDMDESDAVPAVSKLPVQADFLIAKASPSGYISFRNKDLGSIFIRGVAEVFEKFAFEQEVMWLMTCVHGMVANDFESNSYEKPELHGLKQIPEVTFRLTKHLYFTNKGPGIVKDYTKT